MFIYIYIYSFRDRRRYGIASVVYNHIKFLAVHCWCRHIGHVRQIFHGFSWRTISCHLWHVMPFLHVQLLPPPKGTVLPGCMDGYTWDLPYRSKFPFVRPCIGLRSSILTFQSHCSVPSSRRRISPWFSMAHGVQRSGPWHTFKQDCFYHWYIMII